MKTGIAFLLSAALWTGAVVPAAWSAPRNWNGATTGAWETAANWGGEVPTTNDDVVIAHSNAVVILSAATFPLASIQVGGTLIFTNWNTILTAADVVVSNGGRITHYVNTDSNAPWTPNNRVVIDCSNLTVQGGGAINTDARGYTVGGLGKPSYGPGAGANTYYFGGGHGGGGGVGDILYAFSSGQSYGDPFAPTNPGSAGGSHGSVGLGGNGGGAIQITASGEVRVDGSVTANGGAYIPTYGAGGSGGSVLIVCDTFTGSGAVRARGGIGNTSGPCAGGGGGRIAIRYGAAQSNLVAQPLVLLDAGGGLIPAATAGDLGTLWLPDALLMRESLTNLNGQVYGLAAWAPDRIACTNNRVRFAEDGFQLRVTNEVLVAGAAGGLEIGRARYAGNRLYAIASNALVSADVGGDLTLTNGAVLRLFSAVAHNAPDYGARLSATGRVDIYSNAVLSLYSDVTNGGSALVQAAGVQVAAGGRIEADGKGYGNLGVYAGSTLYTNMGVGPGFSSDNSGGSHGGGGSRAKANPSQIAFPADVLTNTYGSATNPVTAGSTGGRHLNTHARLGNDGGGVVRIVTTGRVAVAGTISANGADATGAYDGGGAGGSVNIRCRTIEGAGVVRANGGAAPDGTAYYGGGGGGGRVAVWYDTAAQAGLPVPGLSFSTAGGTHGNVGTWQVCVGDVGTLFFPDNRFLVSPLQHSGEWRVEGVTNWALDSLLVSNQWFRFPEPNFTLTVTNGLTVTGTTSLWHRLELANGRVSCGWGEIRNGRIGLSRTGLGGSRLTATGGVWVDRGWLAIASGGTDALLESPLLTLTNAGVFLAEAAATNPAVADHGGLVSVEAMEIASGSAVRPFTHPLNGGAVSFVVGRLRIAPGGSLDASAAGFREMGNFNTNSGTGPGRGNDYGGGGHGGPGGTPASGTAGSLYGVTNAPLLAGSSGGKRTTVWLPYNWGGGVVRVKADRAVVEGAIRADGGGTGVQNGGGGGSGGSILLWVKSLQGLSGTLSARGGNGSSGASEAGGGGGRIALWLGGITEMDAQNLLGNLPAAGAAVTTNWSGLVGAVSLAGGTNTTATPRPGGAGSFVALSKPLPARGSLIVVR